MGSSDALVAESSSTMPLSDMLTATVPVEFTMSSVWLAAMPGLVPVPVRVKLTEVAVKDPPPALVSSSKVAPLEMSRAVPVSAPRSMKSVSRFTVPLLPMVPVELLVKVVLSASRRSPELTLMVPLFVTATPDQNWV